MMVEDRRTPPPASKLQLSSSSSSRRDVTASSDHADARVKSATETAAIAGSKDATTETIAAPRSAAVAAAGARRRGLTNTITTESTTEAARSRPSDDDDDEDDSVSRQTGRPDDVATGSGRGSDTEGSSGQESSSENTPASVIARTRRDTFNGETESGDTPAVVWTVVQRSSSPAHSSSSTQSIDAVATSPPPPPEKRVQQACTFYVRPFVTTTATVAATTPKSQHATVVSIPQFATNRAKTEYAKTRPDETTNAANVSGERNLDASSTAKHRSETAKGAGAVIVGNSAADTRRTYTTTKTNTNSSTQTENIKGGKTVDSSRAPTVAKQGSGAGSVGNSTADSGGQTADRRSAFDLQHSGIITSSDTTKPSTTRGTRSLAGRYEVTSSRSGEKMSQKCDANGNTRLATGGEDDGKAAEALVTSDTAPTAAAGKYKPSDVTRAVWERENSPQTANAPAVNAGTSDSANRTPKASRLPRRLSQKDSVGSDDTSRTQQTEGSEAPAAAAVSPLTTKLVRVDRMLRSVPPVAPASIRSSAVATPGVQAAHKLQDTAAAVQSGLPRSPSTKSTTAKQQNAAESEVEREQSSVWRPAPRSRVTSTQRPTSHIPQPLPGLRRHTATNRDHNEPA